MRKIGIIGGGASGVLAALHCWKKFQKNCHIVVFDPTSQLGLGKAYSTEQSQHLLNIPANEMHIYANHSDDFETWVLKKNSSLKHSAHWPFVPRLYFGQYLQHHLSKIPNTHFKHIQQKVIHTKTIKSSYSVTTKENQEYDFDYLIIATGYEKNCSTLPVQSKNISTSKVHLSSDFQSENSPKLSGHVLIIGSGLTGIDIWRDHQKTEDLNFTFLSRHGFLPLRRKASSQNIKLPNFAGMSPIQIFQVLKMLKRSTTIEWAQIADNLQTQVQNIWTCWTSKEKEIFLKYLKPYWEVSRHQMPNSVANEIQKDLDCSRTNLVAGRIQSIVETEKNIQVSYKNRRTKQITTLICNHIIFAIGPKIENSLIPKSAIANIHQCSYGFGYLNENAPRVWCVGPASKGDFFEITSVPFIRTQAEMVAQEIEQSLKHKRSFKIEKFFIHPRMAKESYSEHLFQASSFGFILLKLTWYVFVHALLPYKYINNTSACIRNLAAVLSKRRQKSTNVPIVKSINTNPKLKIQDDTDTLKESIKFV